MLVLSTEVSQGCSMAIASTALIALIASNHFPVFRADAVCVLFYYRHSKRTGTA